MTTKSRKVSAYVKAHWRHAKLAAQYEAKLETLMPLKRKRDAAHIDLRIRAQGLTGSQQGEANRIINTAPLTPAETRKARAKLYPKEATQ